MAGPGVWVSEAQAQGPSIPEENQTGPGPFSLLSWAEGGWQGLGQGGKIMGQWVPVKVHLWWMEWSFCRVEP